MTSRFNLFFRNDILSDEILFIGLIALRHVDFMFLALFTPNSFIKTWT